jgi:polysaccharide biosynthesis transport protein
MSPRKCACALPRSSSASPTSRSKNYDRLPEFAQSNTQMLQGAIQEARDIDSRMQALNQQIGFLDAQLAQIEPRMPAVTETGQTIMAPGVRLRALREQYVGSSRSTRPSTRAWRA